MGTKVPQIAGSIDCLTLVIAWHSRWRRPQGITDRKKDFHSKVTSHEPIHKLSGDHLVSWQRQYSHLRLVNRLPTACYDVNATYEAILALFTGAEQRRCRRNSRVMFYVSDLSVGRAESA